MVKVGDPIDEFADGRDPVANPAQVAGFSGLLVIQRKGYC